MAVEADSTQQAHRAPGRGGAWRRCFEPRSLAWIGPAALAGAAVTAALCVTRFSAIPAGSAAAIALIGLAALGAAAFSAWRAWGVSAGRLDLLRRALDAAPGAQIILGPDGRAVHANAEFEKLFSGGGGSGLAGVARRAAADPAQAAELHRLRQRAAAGEPAAGAIALGDARDGAPACIGLLVAPLRGRPGYSLWNFEEFGGGGRVEARRDDEPTAAADRRDDASSGCCSAAADGRAAGRHPERHPRSGVRGPGKEDQRNRDLGQADQSSSGQSSSDQSSSDQSSSCQSDRRFFADAPIGIAVVDRCGRFVEANPAVGELFGAAPRELIGCELIRFVNEADRTAIAAGFRAAADGLVDRQPLEVRLGGARERTIVLLLSRLHDQDPAAPPDGASAHLAAGGADGGSDVDPDLTLYFIDVTDQKHLETQFAQSQKMQAVGQLAGGVAHDFNNLLTAMIGFCDLLLVRSRPGDPAFADIMQIKQNANRAANLVRQLLAFSRQQTLQPRVLDITDVLVELSHLLRRLIGENIELEVVHGRDLGLVKVDQGQLEQVVINLAVNARDAMPGGGRLTISTTNVRREAALRRGPEIMPAGDYVRVAVADTGAGISPDNLARIFEPFFSTKEVGSGTGLGLSTVYGIVKQTGGFVFADSAPGRGAVFEIYLPRHQPAAGAAAARLEAADPTALKDLTGTANVMLVEDDDAVRMFGARALRNKGYRVTEAKSGEGALDLIRDSGEKIDLLITDVVMPQMDGPSLIREVRVIDPAIKVIFISGYTEDAFRQRLDSDSDIHFLPKPFSLKQLAIKVKDVIDSDIG